MQPAVLHFGWKSFQCYSKPADEQLDACLSGVLPQLSQAAQQIAIDFCITVTDVNEDSDDIDIDCTTPDNMGRLPETDRVVINHMLLTIFFIVQEMIGWITEGDREVLLHLSALSPKERNVKITFEPTGTEESVTFKVEKQPGNKWLIKVSDPPSGAPLRTFTRDVLRNYIRGLLENPPLSSIGDA